MKCAICFTDAGDQICEACGAPSCNNHIDEDGLCPDTNRHGQHDEEAPDDVKEEETPEEPPQPKRRSSRSKPADEA